MSESTPPQAQGPESLPEPAGSSVGSAVSATTRAASSPPYGTEESARGVPPGVARRTRLGTLWLAVLALAVLVLGVAWWLNGRLYATQAEIARRLQEAETASIEARTIAKQSADVARDLNSRVAVLQSREQDLSAQRQALQQLYEDFAKSRDDAFLGQTAEIISLAQQQAQLTGSLAPLVGTLESSAARLKRASGNPRAAMVLRAVQRDLSKLKSSVAPDVPAAAQRLDQLAALIDQLQTVSSASPWQGAVSGPSAGAPRETVAGPRWAPWLGHWAQAAWNEVRQLVVINKVDNPDVLLMSPQQADYLRENLKLRVLNARLDLLSRNASAYRSDMQAVEAALRADFNVHQPRTQMALTLARQAAQIDLAAQPAANLQSLSVLANLGQGGN